MQRTQVHLLVDTLLDLGQNLAKRHAMPEEARQHFRTARREALLGVRSLVDAAIDRLDQQAEAAEPERPRSIPVE